jgi:tryptophan synthase alpha chain
MMNGLQRIKQIFENNKAFVAYLTAGDGGIKHTLEAALALIDGGINMLEIGVPFSDPVADGPVIQQAAARALNAGTTLHDVLWLAGKIRLHSEIPLILFSYFNPILAVLKSSFFRQAQQAGIDGALIVDCPVEESQLFHQECLAHQIAPIYIVTPFTSPQRIRKINNYGKGFLYYACRKGTTGLRDSLPEDFAEKMQIIKSIVDLPVVAGFGISQRPMAEQVLQYADGVVVGSLFVKALAEGAKLSELTQLARNVNPIKM